MSQKRTGFAAIVVLASLVSASISDAQDVAAKPQIVQVKLSEWSMGFMTMTVKGAAQFEVVNTGKYPHAFAIEGKLGEKKFEVSTGWLKAGEKTTLMVNLPAGTYDVYCPVPGHEAKGMKGAVTFQ